MKRIPLPLRIAIYVVVLGVSAFSSLEHLSRTSSTGMKVADIMTVIGMVVITAGAAYYEIRVRRH